MDPFATLGLERAFELDLVKARAAHRELSRALHPDRYVGASATERRQALAKAVEVNEAWRIVRDPIRRAEALLALHGVHVVEDHRGGPTDPDFLMSILELREALSEAKGARDVDTVRRMARDVEARLAATERALTLGFERGEHESLVGTLGELRFYRRFLDEVSAIEDELAA